MSALARLQMEGKLSGQPWGLLNVPLEQRLVLEALWGPTFSRRWGAVALAQGDRRIEFASIWKKKAKQPRRGQLVSQEKRGAESSL